MILILGQKLDFFGLEDPVELVRQAAFENQLERLGSPGSGEIIFYTRFYKLICLLIGCYFRFSEVQLQTRRNYER